MAIITISRALREKLGDQGADGLADTLSKLEGEFKENVIEVVLPAF